MKIHFIISTLRGGGAERVLTLLAENLAKLSKYEVSVITLNEGSEYELDENMQWIDLSYGKIPNHTFRSFINLFKYYRNKSKRPDIIISFITLTNLITIPIAKLYGIKIIAAEHNSYLRKMHGRALLTDFTRKILYRFANLVTVLTSFDVEYYKKYGVNVVVMPNPCSFKPVELTNKERDKVILSIGSLDRYHHKGFDNLIPLIKPILQSHPDWHLKIVGGGDNGLQFLSDIVKKNQLEKQITFTGFLNNIPELMQASSIFILPSRYEGLPMVLLEAMSQGMACIAYDCKTGPSDIITNELNGLLIEDQNKNEMSSKLVELIENQTLRDALRENGVKSLEKYDIKTILNRYEKIFEEMIFNN